MTSFFSALGGPSADIQVRLDVPHDRELVPLKGEKEEVESCPVYLDGEVSLYFVIAFVI